MILDSKKIAYTKIDISADESAKEEMRKLAGDPKALPPQLANGNQYCGVRLSVCVIDGYFTVTLPCFRTGLPGF